MIIDLSIATRLLHVKLNIKIAKREKENVKKRRKTPEEEKEKG
jgi:hypothetical protein